MVFPVLSTLQIGKQLTDPTPSNPPSILHSVTDTVYFTFDNLPFALLSSPIEAYLVT